MARLEACYNGLGSWRYPHITYQPRDPVRGLARLLARRKGAGLVRTNLLRGGESIAYESIAIVKNLIISVSVSYEMLQKLDKYCKFHAICRSEALRDALEMLLWCEDIGRSSAQQEVDAYFDAQK